MPARLALIVRYLALFLLLIAIALIIIRWKFPSREPESQGFVASLREFWRRLSERREDLRERAANLRALRDKFVLLVDPDDKSARVLNWKFGSLGCRMFRVRTGATGIARARSETPDFVVVDALLSDVSAADFYNSLGRSDIPVIFIGVLAAQWDELHILGRNIRCVSKPFDPDEVAALVGLMLRRAERDREQSDRA